MRTVEAVENDSARSHTGKICLRSVRLMNMDLKPNTESIEMNMGEEIKR